MSITEIKKEQWSSFQVHKLVSLAMTIQYNRASLVGKMRFFNFGLLCFLLIGILATVTESFRLEPESAMNRGEAGCRGGGGKRRRGGRTSTTPPEDGNSPDDAEGVDADP